MTPPSTVNEDYGGMNVCGVSNCFGYQPMQLFEISECALCQSCMQINVGAVNRSVYETRLCHQVERSMNKTPDIRRERRRQCHNWDSRYHRTNGSKISPTLSECPPSVSQMNFISHDADNTSSKWTALCRKSEEVGIVLHAKFWLYQYQLVVTPAYSINDPGIRFDVVSAYSHSCDVKSLC
jgi:hypothetical protein